MYDREKINLAKFQKKSEGSPNEAYHFSGELRNYHDTEPNMNKNGILNDKKQKEIIHGYMASVSYIDAQVGKILKAVKENNLLENTTIVLWGDHGWHLGDHGQWAKHSNFEQATRSPLIIVDPETKKNNFK